MNSSETSSMSFVAGSCQHIQSLIDSYVDGEMPDEFRFAFERHLMMCSGCKDCVEGTRRVVQAARLLDSMPIPQAVSLRLRKALEAKLDIRFGNSAVVRPIFRVPSEE